MEKARKIIVNTYKILNISSKKCWQLQKNTKNDIVFPGAQTENAFFYLLQGVRFSKIWKIKRKANVIFMEYVPWLRPTESNKFKSAQNEKVPVPQGIF